MRQLCYGWGKKKKEARTGTTTGTATGASTSRGPATATGTLTDLDSSADAAGPETPILEVNEVGCTVIYEGEEPLLAE